jgi:hypothetical protein
MSHHQSLQKSQPHISVYEFISTIISVTTIRMKYEKSILMIAEKI